MFVIQAVLNALLHALQISLFMFWEVLWPLALGFLLSAMIQTVVSKRAVAGALGRPDFRGFVLACGFGAASSSCSYAAVAVARALFRRGASFVNAIIFEFASTNLVFELGLVLLILLGWQFVAAEFAGGLLMATIVWILFKVTLRQRIVDEARRQADRGVFGSTHEAHGEHDVSITDGPFLSRLFSGRAFTAISQAFYMDLYALYTDLALGFLIAGALAAWVPNAWWQAFFLTSHPTLNAFWSPLIGPVISMLSFVCSVGNVPLAVVLWNGGISFGGVISFIFADLIILPILNIYRKYYGGRTSLYLLGVSYVAMALAGFLIGGAFQLLGLAPTNHHVTVFETRPAWNYTTFLDIAFLVLMAVLAWRFVTTGGIDMLRAHSRRPVAGAQSAHDPANYLSQVTEHDGHQHQGDEMESKGSAVDPVCGMNVERATAEYRSFRDGETYYFCSAGCKQAFDKDPEKFLSGSAGHRHH